MTVKKMMSHKTKYCARPVLCKFEHSCVSYVLCIVLHSCLLHKQHALSFSKVFGVSRQNAQHKTDELFHRFLTCGLSEHHMHAIRDSKSIHVPYAFPFSIVTLARPRLLVKQSLQLTVFDTVKQLNPSVVVSVCTAEPSSKSPAGH